MATKKSALITARLTLVPAMRDTFVHYLFGTKRYEGILLSFINAVLENADRLPVASVETLNPFDPATFATEKYTILDVKATDVSGKIFTIEFQTCEYVSFAERLLYYWARTYARQLRSGEDYRTLQQVISIAVVGYSFFTELPDIHNVFSVMCENNPQYRLTDDLQIHTLEVASEKINGLYKVKPALRNWINFFYYADKKSEAEMRTLLKDDKTLGYAYDAYRQFNNDTKLRAIDDAREQYLHDVNSLKGDAFIKGEARGKVEGAALSVQSVLNARFHTVTSKVQKQLSAITDVSRLENLVGQAAVCPTLKDFEKLSRMPVSLT